MADASGPPPPDEFEKPNGSGQSGSSWSSSEPPPLLDVRVKGDRPRGLNRPAILGVAGTALAIVLILASLNLAPDQRRQPSTSRPPLSDPAMTTMAEARVRELPADYGEAQAFGIKQDAEISQPGPLLGPPLPGDIGAFSADQTRPDYADERYDPASGWNGSEYVVGKVQDPAETEAMDALRSGLFFTLRDGAATKPSEDGALDANAVQAHPLTVLAAPTVAGESDASLHPGAVIGASLMTAIDSQAPGPVIAQVTHPVYDSLNGRTLIIPQGARLIGDYNSSSRYGQDRLSIAWSRLIMPDGEEIAIDEVAVDPAGSAGIAGKVDNHWRDVFGAAALGTLINIGVATTEDRPSVGVTFGGVGITGSDPVNDALREGAQRSASIVTNRVVDRTLDLPPTIRIKAGVKVSVIVTRRLAP